MLDLGVRGAAQLHGVEACVGVFLTSSAETCAGADAPSQWAATQQEATGSSSATLYAPRAPRVRAASVAAAASSICTNDQNAASATRDGELPTAHLLGDTAVRGSPGTRAVEEPIAEYDALQ